MRPRMQICEFWSFFGGAGSRPRAAPTLSLGCRLRFRCRELIPGYENSVNFPLADEGVDWLRDQTLAEVLQGLKEEAEAEASPPRGRITTPFRLWLTLSNLRSASRLPRGRRAAGPSTGTTLTPLTPCCAERSQPRPSQRTRPRPGASRSSRTPCGTPCAASGSTWRTASSARAQRCGGAPSAPSRVRPPGPPGNSRRWT